MRRRNTSVAGLGDRGIALIAVLWVLALLTLMATAVEIVSVTARRASARALESVQAECAADGALRLVIHQLLRHPTVALADVGTAQSVMAGAQPVAVTLQRESGRIDVNDAAPIWLQAVFAGNGWTEGAAATMRDEIVEARGTPRSPSRDGSDSAVVPISRAQTPLASVGALRMLPGGERISAEILDALTVYSHLPEPVRPLATAAVRNAKAWIERRDRTPAGTGSAEAAASPENLPVGAEILRLRACTVTGLSMCRQAVVRLAGGRNNPLQVFEWARAQ